MQWAEISPLLHAVPPTPRASSWLVYVTMTQLVVKNLMCKLFQY